MRHALATDERMPRPDTRPLLEAHGIGLARGGRWLFRGVDFAIGRGALHALIGANGAGKTTILRLLLGVEAPTEGRIGRRPALRIGYVPQHFAVDRTLPIQVRQLMSLTDRVPLAAIRDALRRVGAETLLDRPVQVLSGGEMQRVLLARALISRPELLILDEPARGLDVDGVEELDALIAAVRHSSGCGVLLVSHDIDAVMSVADRLVVLHEGRAVTGSPSDLADHPAVRRRVAHRGWLAPPSAA